MTIDKQQSVHVHKSRQRNLLQKKDIFPRGKAGPLPLLYMTDRAPAPTAAAMAFDSKRNTQEAISGKTGFLDLPRELRDQIYDLAIIQPYRHSMILIGVQPTGFLCAQPEDTCFGDAPLEFQVLRQTSKQIQAEATEVFFQRSRFHCCRLPESAIAPYHGVGPKGNECETCAHAFGSVRDLIIAVEYRERSLGIGMKWNGKSWILFFSFNGADIEEAFTHGMEPLIEEKVKSVSAQHQSLTLALVEDIYEVVLEALEQIIEHPEDFARRFGLEYKDEAWILH